MCLLLRINGIIGWIGGNFISREVNVLKINKTWIRLHTEYWTLSWAPVVIHGNWSVILRLKDLQRGVIKIVKWLKDFCYKEWFKKLWLTTLLERRIRGDLIETFKIINGISNYGRYFFNFSPQTGNLLWRQISKTKSINWNFVLIFLHIFGTNGSKTAIL